MSLEFLKNSKNQASIFNQVSLKICNALAVSTLYPKPPDNVTEREITIRIYARYGFKIIPFNPSIETNINEHLHVNPNCYNYSN